MMQILGSLTISAIPFRVWAGVLLVLVSSISAFLKVDDPHIITTPFTTFQVFQGLANQYH